MYATSVQWSDTIQAGTIKFSNGRQMIVAIGNHGSAVFEIYDIQTGIWTMAESDWLWPSAVPDLVTPGLFLDVRHQQKVYKIQIINKTENFYLLLVAEGTQ